MFGQQDDTQAQPAADPWAGQQPPAGDPTAVPAPVPAPAVDPTAYAAPAQPLLDAQATDGYSDPAAVVPEPVPQPVNDGVGDNQLLDIKQQALQQLSPLVDKLDQSPEEKFRTMMMMIQASDNQELIRSAYEAANQIGDEKARAQALLDIINEINYFTQH